MNEGFKRAGAILIPELLLAPPVTLGAVYCMTTLAPNTLKHMESAMSKYIVTPRLEMFESLGGSIRKAHRDHDQKKRQELETRHQAIGDSADAPITSREERADAISKVLTKGAIACATDYLATLAGQRLLAHHLGAPVDKWVAVFESVAHLGGIAIMATMPRATAVGENEHYWIKHQLKRWGVKKERADDIGTAIPFIIQPGQIAALASLGLASCFRVKGGRGP